MNPLFSRILVALDGSEASENAFEFAIGLARQYNGELLICYALDIVRLVVPRRIGEVVPDAAPLITALTDQGRSVLTAATRRAQEQGVTSVAHLEQGDPVSAILSIAKSHGAELIILGTHGRSGAGQPFLGSTAEGVLRSSSIPVLMVREGRERPVERTGTHIFERIIVGLDGSAPSQAALHLALDLSTGGRAAPVFCTAIDLAHVTGTFGLHMKNVREELERDAHAIVDDAVADARERGIAAEGIVVAGDAASTLLRLADERHADLLILGSHGRHGLQRFLLGSVAEAAVRKATIPVLVVRQNESSLHKTFTAVA